MVILFMQYLIIFLISMVPLIELRGAIPYAIGFKLPLLPSYIICILGNMLPVPFIFLFARKILVWGSDKSTLAASSTGVLKRRERRKEASGKGRKRALCGTVFVCRNTASGNRRMDRNTCSKPS